ncbi:MAG: putative arginine N-methyltransferase 3-like [Trebouxia sp. A1-2]|nr:MAG: putative arginine N-methyltransferase 3-like [Trebouxia sp. A1-2]
MSSEEEDERDWSDWGDDVDEDLTKSLFSNAILSSAKQAIEHDASEHGFDLRKFRAQKALTDYDTIRCVNFIRNEVAAGNSPLQALLHDNSAAQRPWEKDEYMHPVLPDDPLLYFDFEEDACAQQDSDAGPSASTCNTSTVLQSLQDENMALRNTLQEMSRLALPSELATEQPFQLAEGIDSDWLSKWQKTAGTFGVQAERNKLATTQSDVRTEAYRDALKQNPALMQGATVLDVGCGTGILSMFAAEGGAAKIIGVDGSTRIADVAERLVAANGLASSGGGPITIMRGRLEQLPSLPVEQVDVIVSEWMGYALLFESMLDTVLYARDRWLKPGGAILPDLASLHMAAAGAGATGLTFWNKVYGFDYSLVQQELWEDAHQTALLKDVSSQDLLSRSCLLRQLDIAHMDAADASFSTDFVLEADPKSCCGPQECHALVLWFDTDFSQRFCAEQPVKLSTSPCGPQTHWCQTVLVLRKPIQFGLGTAEAKGKVAASLKGRFSMARSDQHRGIDMSVEYSAQFTDGTLAPSEVQIFSMTMSS